MNIQENIQQVFEDLLKKHNDNAASAARSIGVGHVTFWGWIKNGQKRNAVLFSALDKLGVTLLINGEPIKTANEKDDEIKRLMLENERLKREVGLFEKLVARLEEVANMKTGQEVQKRVA